MIRVQWEELNPVVSYANYLKCEPAYQFGPRIIYDHQFIYVAKGKGTATIQQRKYEAVEGDLFYYGPKVVHCFQADTLQPFELIGVHFTLNCDLRDRHKLLPVSDPADPLYKGNENIVVIGNQGLEQLRLPERASFQVPEFHDLLLKMVARIKQNDGMSAALNRGLLLQAFYMIHAHIRKAAEPLSPQKKTVFTVQSRLALNADSPYDRGWISEWTGYNEDYVSRQFRRQFGVSPHRYHTHQKIERAKELLEHTDMSVTEVADQLHFTSVHYFCRVFKELTTFSPLQYRNLAQFL